MKILLSILVIALVIVGVILLQKNAPESPTNLGSQEMKIEDITVGEGAEAKPGDMVTVHYVGTLTDGTKFDSSRDRGEPFSFLLGSGQVIDGWDRGVAGMKEGGTRRLVIPPDLAYGGQAVGQIPANSTLNFEIELIKTGPLGQ